MYLCSLVTTHMGSSVYFLLVRDLRREVKEFHTLGGTFLYAISTVFIAFLVFHQTEPHVWNALFWIITLFAAINATNRNFVSESGRQYFFYYSLCSPEGLVTAKIIFNSIYLFILSLITYAMLSVILGNPVQQTALFIIALLLGSVALATALTFVSALSARTTQKASMLALLGFPVIIPVLLAVVRITAACMFPVDWREVLPELFILAGAQLLMLAMCLVLFPFVWRS